jgi:opacity protein-like surface antigen
MIWVRSSIVTAALLCLVITGVAQADSEQSEYLRRGFYGGLAGVVAIENFDGSGDREQAYGFEMQVGYRATSIFSFEVDLEYAKQFEYEPGEVLNPAGRLGPETVTTLIITGNLKANANLESWGVTPRLQPYGKIGFGGFNARFDADPYDGVGPYDKTDIAMKVGGGVDFYVTRAIVINVEARYNMLLGQDVYLDFDGLDYLAFGFGAQLRF